MANVREAGPPAHVLEWACEYRRHGLAVLPLDGKRPHSGLIRRTHGTTSTKKLIADGASEEHLRDWFSRSDTNVGIFVGEASGGLAVVDLDACEIPPPGATLPLTPTVKTGRETLHGYHLYYQGDSTVRNRKAPWGEVRAQTPQYVVAPPSIHPETGRAYEWQLGLGELSLANFTDVLLPESERENSKLDLYTEHQPPIRPTEELLLGTPNNDAEDLSWLKRFDRDENAVTAMAVALGIRAPLGTAFHCVLHPDRNPSASLYQSASGDWLYHDFHSSTHRSGEWLSLAQVRARRAGRTGRLSASEHATWKLILLVEAGLLPPVSIPALPPPAIASNLARHLYERFLFLLGCRWHYTPGAPAPLTREFAAALCSLTVRQARAAIDELLELQAICVAGRIGRPAARLFLPAGIEQAHGKLP